MPIIVNLDVMMAMRRISSGELAAAIGLSQANLSILKTGKARAIRFSTLEAICEALSCQPGEILEYSQNAPARAGRLEVGSVGGGLAEPAGGGINDAEQ